MKIDYGGRIWDFDLEEMTVGQCEAVEKYVGKGLGEWAAQLAAGSIKGLVALWWVIRAQAGENPGPPDRPGDDFRPVRLLAAFADAERAETAAEEAAAAQEDQSGPDPTLPAGSSPAPAGTKTTPAPAAASPSLPG